ncbi:MAG: phosphate ABC transporter permease PstA [Erysipelotrichaceae bacterium]
MKQLTMKRKNKDCFLNIITYLSSSLFILILIAIFYFVFSKGGSLLSWDLLKDDYWSKNYLIDVQQVSTTDFVKPDDLSKDAVFSKKWGIGFVDHVSHEKSDMILVEYIDPNSPFLKATNASAGPQKGKSFSIEVGMQAEKINFKKQDGTSGLAGNIVSQTASQLVDTLDNDAHIITQSYIKTIGGGIRGSIITTFYLILLSLAIALPIGVCAAIYLNEYASKSKLNKWLRSGIETLTGVPSIIYGLMGVSVLFPITKALGASTTNILLGSLTLSIILLPTIIRSTQEALLVIPNHLRDASLAVGANKSQTIFKIVLPCATPGILTGVLLSMGRVIGESAALIYTMGTFINDSPTILSQGTSLAVHIWSVMSGEQPNFELACAISIILLIFVLCLNITVKLVSKRFTKTWY